MGSHPHQPSELAAHLDYTLLKPDASREEIKLRCQEAAHLGLNAVTLHSSRLTLASLILEDSPVKICCVVGFPFGAPDSDIKRYETEVAIDLGAEEIALVINPIHLRTDNLNCFSASCVTWWRQQKLAQSKWCFAKVCSPTGKPPKPSN